MKQPAVYMMANRRNGTIYTGVTSNLVQRAWQHRQGVGNGFTKRYGCKLLVWYELADTMEAAIVREKQIKGGSRPKKLALVEAMNPTGAISGTTLPTPSRHCEERSDEAIQHSNVASGLLRFARNDRATFMTNRHSPLRP